MLQRRRLPSAGCLAVLLLCLVNNQMMSGDFIDFYCLYSAVVVLSSSASLRCLQVRGAKERKRSHTQTSAASDLRTAHGYRAPRIHHVRSHKHYLTSVQMEQPGRFIFV